MRNYLTFLCFFISFNANADTEFCKRAGNEPSKLIVGYKIKFCFGTEKFMGKFAEKMQSEEIPFVVYEDGHLGYKTQDKDRVQVLGDELIMEYLQNREEYQ